MDRRDDERVTIRAPIPDLAPGERRLEGAVAHYLGRVLRMGLTDWRLAGPRPIGASLRRSALIVALLAGVAVAGGTYTVQSSWLAHRHHDHHDGFRSPEG